MAAFIHQDEARPSVTLGQLSAIESIVRRSIPADAALVELEVRPSRPGNPAPLEVRATITAPDTWVPDEAGWAGLLGAEIRRGWDRADFTFALRTVHTP